MITKDQIVVSIQHTNGNKNNQSQNTHYSKKYAVFSLGEKYSLETRNMADHFRCNIGPHRDFQPIPDVYGRQHYLWDERIFSSFIFS